MRMKKMVTFGMAAACVLSTLSVASPVKADDTITLRMWGGVPAESGPQKVCDNFNEAYKDKGIQVEYERFVNDDTGNLKLETNLLSGTGVDLYMTYGISQLTKRRTTSAMKSILVIWRKHIMWTENHMLCRQNWINTEL